MKYLLLILFTFTIASCSQQQEKELSISTGSDTIILKDREKLFISSSGKSLKNYSDLLTEKTKSCIIKNPKGKFNFTLEAGEFSNEKEQKYPISAWITITDINNKKLQEIHFEPNSWATVISLPCEKFFVKDFNFDGLEDFAILWDIGGSGGELYEYYFQDKKVNFSIIKSYPLQHGVLAEEINTVNKTISTQTIVGCCHYNLNTYELKSDGSWETSSQQKQINEK